MTALLSLGLVACNSGVVLNRFLQIQEDAAGVG